MAPADEAQLVAWIVRLWHDTSHRDPVASDDAKVIIASRVERLRAYPADIVERTLTDWPTVNKWWPDSWKDLQDALEPQTRLRCGWLEDLDLLEAVARTVRISVDPGAQARMDAADAQAALEADREHDEIAAGLRGLVVKLSDARTEATRRGAKPRARFTGGAA